MIPVKQTKLYGADGIHNGNCLAACLASLLELPLWMIPPFDDMFGRKDYHGRVSQWLKTMMGMQQIRNDGHNPEKLPEFYIACGSASRGVLHSVIYSKGKMVHDPHYSEAGLTEIDWTWHLEKV